MGGVEQAADGQQVVRTQRRDGLAHPDVLVEHVNRAPEQGFGQLFDRGAVASRSEATPSSRQARAHSARRAL